MPPTKRSRKHLTSEKKLAVLRHRLIDKVPISTLCDEAKLQPSDRQASKEEQLGTPSRDHIESS